MANCQLLNRKFECLRPPLEAFLVLVILGFALGCNPQSKPDEIPAPEVSVANPVEVNFADTLEFTGNLEASQSVNLRARVSGYLHQIHFKDGAEVKEGDLLFTIEQEPFRVALDMAKAAHEKAEANLKLAKAEMNRTQPLVQRGALSEQEGDVKSADVSVATADVNAALAAIRQAELNLNYTEVRAPISGRIGRRLVDEENLIDSQVTVLTTIECYSPIYAYFGVSENDMLTIESVAREESLLAQSGEVSIGLSNEGTFPFSGTLDFTQLGVDQETGTQMRRAEIKNVDKRLKPGMFVRIQVPLGAKRMRIMIPQRAVSVDQQGEFLLVVNEQKKVERRNVKLGTSTHGLRVVEQGAEISDVVVVNGLQRARELATVNTTDVRNALPGVDMQYVKENSKNPEGTSEQPKVATATRSGE
jgi:RND family efflux transporter MFP subunit